LLHVTPQNTKTHKMWHNPKYELADLFSLRLHTTHLLLVSMANKCKFPRFLMENLTYLPPSCHRHTQIAHIICIFDAISLGIKWKEITLRLNFTTNS
jgi:hypothetical protein